MNKNIGIAGAVIAVLVGTFGAVSCDSPEQTTGKTVAAEAPRPKTMDERVHEWRTSPGLATVLDDIEGDLKSVGDSAGTYDVTGINSACLSGVEDTQTLKGVPVYPAQPQLWKNMVHELDEAFSTCAAGDYTTSSTYLNLASRSMNALTADMAKYS